VVTASTGKFDVALPAGRYMIRAFTNHVNGGLCRPAEFIWVIARRTIHIRLI
jgi:hypothetical protein